MKKISLVSLFVFAPFFMVTSLAQQTLKIEDFEDGNLSNYKYGYWYSFNDNTGGGESKVEPSDWQSKGIVSPGHDSKKMLKVKVELKKANYKWDPYYAFATEIPASSDFNMSDYGGITYWHKGVGHTFRVDIPTVMDYDYHVMEVPASAEWTKVTIDFKDLRQEGWGKNVPLLLDEGAKLVWVLRRGTGIFQLDDVEFVEEIVYEKQYNMQVLPAEIPQPLAIKGHVKTPLNELSKKYLTKGMNFTNWGESNKITSSNPEEWKYNEASVKKQADQGLLGIRLPIDLDLYIVDREAVLKGEKDKVEVEPLLFTVLDSMNVWTKKYKMSYTIDFHAYDGTYNRAASKDSIVYFGVMSALWKRVAEHFVAEDREDLFFELTNEPNLSLPEGEKIDQVDWRKLAQRMIDSIRTVDATRPIIFGDVDWYSLDRLIENTPFEDQNIIYCFHMYDPFIFTHQGASWASMGSTKQVPFPYSKENWSTEFRTFGIQEGTKDWIKSAFKNYYKEGNKTFIKNRLVKVKNWAYDYQVPLICNEWGAYNRTALLKDLNTYFKTMGEIFQELDISWQVWFGVFDEEYNLLPGMKQALDL